MSGLGVVLYQDNTGAAVGLTDTACFSNFMLKIFGVCMPLNADKARRGGDDLDSWQKIQRHKAWHGIWIA